MLNLENKIAKITAAFLTVAAVILILSFETPDQNIIGPGQQPQLSVDKKGTVRVVFGSNDQIYCATSTDHGITFGRPVMVGMVKEMHLGMERGPQLATSANCSIVTAMDKSGNIHCFKLNHRTNKWTKVGRVNDQDDSAPEGLMSIAADDADRFYAVWLDTRVNKRNQIYISTIGATNRWSRNRLVYASPDQHVCECCKPNIAVQGSTVAVMFRNWLNGSRDLYLTRSSDMGGSFSAAQKLGHDTWKLNGCPMDGGSVGISENKVVRTVWQRQGNIYYAEPGGPELFLGKGRTPSLQQLNPKGMVIFQSSDTLKTINIADKQSAVIGIGNYSKAARLNDGTNFFVWENNKRIEYKRL